MDQQKLFEALNGYLAANLNETVHKYSSILEMMKNQQGFCFYLEVCNAFLLLYVNYSFT